MPVRPGENNTPTSVMAYPRVYATATLLNDGRVLIAGGSDANAGLVHSITNTAEIFDPATETFSLVSATMSWPRVNHCAVTLADGHILLIGGWATWDGISWNDAGPPNLDEFDPVASSFTSHSITGPLPNSDSNGETRPECFPLSEDRVFINTDRSGPMLLDTVSWTTREIQLSGVSADYKAVYSSAAQTPDGKVWIAGGQVSELENITLSDIVRFDPANENASIIGHLLQARTYAGILSFPDNSIEVYGGAACDATGTKCQGLSSVELVTSAGAASTIGDLPSEKFEFTPVMLQNGKSLQVGGSDVNGLAVETQYVFDEISHTAGATGNMIEKRRGYAITPLNTGRILIAGGADDWGKGSKTAEIFEPDANLYILIPKNTIAPGEFVQLSTETALSGSVDWKAQYGTITASGGYTAPANLPGGPSDISVVLQDEVSATLPTGAKAVAPITIVFPAGL
jgi:hypothetical protein